MRRTLALVLALPTALALAGQAPFGAPDRAAAGDHGNVVSAAPSGELDRPSLGPAPDVTRPGPPAAEAEGSGRGGVMVREPAQEPSPAGDPQSALPEGDVADGEGRAASGRTSEGFLVAAVPLQGGVAGTGPRWRYTIEVEPETGFDVEEVASLVRGALNDPRSWARTRSLEQVDDPRSARIRLLVATPDTVDALCARAGLRTVGIFSCWNGTFAALNGWRWEVGANGFTDLTDYRTYLVNHEFGHGLGYGHVGCPAQGVPAPVMMQQSKGLDGCLPNGWPFP